MRYTEIVDESSASCVLSLNDRNRIYHARDGSAARDFSPHRFGDPYSECMNKAARSLVDTQEQMVAGGKHPPPFAAPAEKVCETHVGGVSYWACKFCIDSNTLERSSLWGS